MFSQAYAQEQDRQDPLRHLRSQFVIPTKAQINSKTLDPPTATEDGKTAPSIYLCGNSLGLQPNLTRKYFQQYLDTWATKGVYGHFKEIEDSNLAPWLHVDDDVIEDMAAIVGALSSEVAVMQTLTGNLHLMMASFYRPSKERYKIILEGKAFPSDHYAVESQIRHQSLDPADAMILIEPESFKSPVLKTDHVLSVIDKHAKDTALLLLPGIQFYSGQLFDIPTITAHAHSKGIIVGWDLAHAAGNVPLKVHDWNVDFAVWCTYKYLNCGPGSIGGAFVHQKHGDVKEEQQGQVVYRPRLSGWWGSSKSSRFAMTNQFSPIPGAAGFQLSNPSVADTTAVRASLDVFKQTSMTALREKSLKLTKYLEDILDQLAERRKCFKIITPRDPSARGAQLSVLLDPGLLNSVMKSLEHAGVVVDERKPDVIRVAPAPLYNSWEDVYCFVKAFDEACEAAVNGAHGAGGSLMVEGGIDDKGWSEVK
ncbi:kynureninase 1 [Teratosphaeria nubilosa]|uniref:Kynureninase n=1 Tax=Teratosphaeria nubilosa TaxID=161662 RepID=A0A6G1KU91_9PEZI|nr:kynureninase 1 [Teratosphaeria nubilosa]